MLYYLLYPLREIWFGFNVFRYITFRAAMGAVTAFVLSLILGPVVVRWLYRLKVGEQVRKEKYMERLSDFYQTKEGTPTMGGILILIVVLISTLMWADIFNKYVLLALFSTLFLGAIGMIDDSRKMMKKKSLGLRPLAKLPWEVGLGLFVGLILYMDPRFPTSLEVPFFKTLVIELGILYVLFACLVVAGSSNAVNLTDGMDGLAIGTMIMIALTYTVMSYLAGHIRFSEYLNIFYQPCGGELAVFCAVLMGACLGFLWFNAYPATVFMGDTGALALGGAIGTTALFIKKELLLLVAGGIYVAEALSVIVQIIFFKATGKRLFLMSPLHYHFKLKGWPENKVTVRFWIIGVILALMSLATLKMR